MEVIGLPILENTLRQYLKVFPGYQVPAKAGLSQVGCFANSSSIKSIPSVT